MQVNVNAKVSLDQILKAFWSSERKYKSIDTQHGEKIDFLNIEPSSINLKDIAKGLSNVCRFAGQIGEFYSVAEHSILVARVVQKMMQVELPGVVQSAFMHDAPEAYVGDITTPLKILCPGILKIEEAFEKAVISRFGLHIKFNHPMVAEADRMMFYAERDTFRNVPVADRMYPLPEGLEIRNLSPREAEKEFLQMAEELGIKEVDSEFATVTP